MGIVSTIPEKCRRCYTCVRECPAKAIKVEAGQATVIVERCVACGNCVKVCAQQAKLIEDSTAVVREMIAGGTPVVACLAPSFPAAFDRLAPGQVIAAARGLGFREVWDVAFGAELVSREYVRLYERSRRDGVRVIATPCPAITAYVEKYMPELHDALAPIVSPMIAIARAVRKRLGPNVRVVFIGPCVAKKNEIRDPAVAGAVDAVLTFREFDQMLADADIRPAELAEGDFDGPRCMIGGSFPIPGGLLRTAGISADILENEVVVTEGKDRVLDALREEAEGHPQGRFFDVLFCEGCISGPRMLNDLSVIARKKIVADYVKARAGQTKPVDFWRSLEEFRSVDLSRAFTRQNLQLRQPTEAEIAAALAAMRKSSPRDQLNCGACGYPSCREKAIAVCQGLAEAEMCLPYLVEELEDTCRRLELSHLDLAAAQNRLVQTERLASMGQLSAGVAHEINNPLGTILLYSHILLKQLGTGESRADLQMIVAEATRCKNIVRGLLDFARQSRVSKEPISVAELLSEVRAIVAPRAAAAQCRVTAEVNADLPALHADRTQVRQVLVNLVENGIDAAPSGHVTVRARASTDGRGVELEVADDGCGIAPENLPRLFTPFFTTKEMGKGTGLGLAIVYGIVKMHSGDISVDSAPGKGTRFLVTLPLSDAAAAVPHPPSSSPVRGASS